MYQKVSILIIEDEKSICDFISKTLHSHDYKVTTAHNGKDGLTMITSSLPDLVLLDLGLPDMDGLEVIKKTREWSSLPIIVISARTQEKEKVAALDAGADDYLPSRSALSSCLPASVRPFAIITGWQTIPQTAIVRILRADW